MVKRDQLLAAVDNSAESLAQFISECKAQKDACLIETLGSCSKKQLDQVWEKTHGHVAEKLHCHMEDQHTAVPVDLSHVVECVVTMLSAMANQKDIYIPQPALQLAVLLRDLVPNLPPTDTKLRSAIAKLFEEWWKKNLPSREDLIISSFVYLVEKSLEPKPKHVLIDVKRVWSLHEVVSLIDLQNDTSEDFRNLLLRCFIYPHYLQQDEGLKFLGYVLSEEEGFTSSLHTLIKEHLLALNRSLHARYGVVYFRAWQRLQGEQLVKFEQDCLQDLMYHSVCAHTTLFPALKKILHHFHLHKKQTGVDAMLLRLYEPFLWRSLRAANHKVRANATDLFFDVFPLQRPDMNVQESEQLLQKQFDMFQELLNDPVPNVRVLAVKGVFRVMKEYWEMIPQEMLRSLTVRLLQALSTEAGSADVREQVIKGITLLLDNMLSHVFLHPLLVEIQNVHDSSEKVRTAMLELLLKVKNLRTIKYWNIVPIEHLLARLAVDTEPVNRRIVKLLFSSFLPLEARSHVQVERCIVLIEANQAAARQFFRHTQNHMSVNDTVSYMMTLCKAIVMDMKQKTREEGQNKGNNMTEQDSDDEEDEEEDASGDSMSNTVVQGIAEAICILWTGSREELKKDSNAALLKQLQKSFSYTLAEMMKVYSDPGIVSVVVQIAGFLPSNYIPTISRKWLPKLRAMTSENNVEEYSVLLETLVLNNRGREVIELTMEWLRSVLEQTDTPQASRKKKKKICFVDPKVPQPQVAVDLLGYIFQQAMTREKFLQNYLPECEELLELLKNTKEAIVRYLTGQPLKIADGEEKFLMSALTLYCQVLLLLHSVNTEKHQLDEMIGLLSWADKHVVPTLSIKDEDSEQASGSRGTTRGQHKKLAFSLIESLLKMFNNLLLVGSASLAMCTQLVDFCSACVAVDEDLQLLPTVLLNLYQVTEFAKFFPQQDDNEEHYNGKVIPNALSRVFVSITAYVKNNPTGSRKLLSSVKGHIVELMKAVFSNSTLEETMVLDIIGTALASVLAEMKFYSQEYNLEEEPSTQTLPPLSCWLLDILQRQADVLKYFVEELIDCCDTGILSDIHSCHSVAHIVCSLAKSKKLQTKLGELYKVADRHASTQLQEMTEEDKESNKETVLSLQSKLEKCRTVLNIPAVGAEQ